MDLDIAQDDLVDAGQGGDDLQAADSRRDLVYYSLVSPDNMQVGFKPTICSSSF